MNATNSVAEGIESHGCRTFSAKEMAFNILGLMHPLVFDVAQIEPVWADVRLLAIRTLLEAADARQLTAQRRHGQAPGPRQPHDRHSH